MEEANQSSAGKVDLVDEAHLANYPSSLEYAGTLVQVRMTLGKACCGRWKVGSLVEESAQVTGPSVSLLVEIDWHRMQNR